MKTLCLDTSTKYIAIGLIENDQLILAKQVVSIRRQSEETLPLLKAMLASIGWQLKMIDQIVLTIGPGSYTGVRIAMTIAKTMAVVKPTLKLYTLSSLQMLCGLENNCVSLIDARSQKVYFGQYDQGHAILPDGVIELDQIEKYLSPNVKVVGDTELINRQEAAVDIVRHMIALKAFWQPVASVHQLVPIYLKDVEAKRR